MSMPGGTTMSTSVSTTGTAMASMATETLSAPSSSATTMMMGMNEMAMTFFTSASTPLYSSAWTPNSTGQYAGTCVFLIAFATIFRAFLAVRCNFFQVLAIVEHRRNRGLMYPKLADDKPRVRPWRAKEAVLVASMDVLLAGTGYLLSGTGYS